MYFPRSGVAVALGLLGALGAERALAQGGGTPPPRTTAAMDSPLPAEDAPPVDSLTAWALRDAPRLEARRRTADAAETRRRAAGALADPRLEVSLEDVAFPRYTVGEEEMSTLGFEVRQDLGGFTERGAARRVARAVAAEQHLEVAFLERQTVRDVRVAYARLYVLDARRRELQSAQAVVKWLRDAATSRFGTGTAAMEPQLRAQLAVARVDAELEDVHAERQVELAQLNRIAGRPAGTSWGVFRALPAPPPGARGAALATHDEAAVAVEVARARAAVQTADQRVELEIRGGRPRFEVAAGYANRGGFDPLVILRLDTGLPVWRRGKQGPLVAAARLEAAAARADMRDAELATAAEQARWNAEWSRADAQLVRVRSTLLPQAEAALDAARAAYGAGRGELVTVLEDWEIWLRARQELSQREADRFAAWAELEVLAPGPELPEPAKGGNP